MSIPQESTSAKEETPTSKRLSTKKKRPTTQEYKKDEDGKLKRASNKFGSSDKIHQLQSSDRIHSPADDNKQYTDETNDEENNTFDAEDDDNNQDYDSHAEEEDDDLGANFAFDDNDNKENNSKDFACLSPEEIVVAQQKEIKIVADLFSLPHSVAASLLRHFNWKREVLIARYLENADQVKRDAGVSVLSVSNEISVPSISTITTTSPQNQSTTHSHQTNTSNSHGNTQRSSANENINRGPAMCTICGDDVQEGSWNALSCKHAFCNDCWREYLTIKINEGEVTRIKCPHIDCKLNVDEQTVKRLVPLEIYDKFVRFITKAFVEHSDGRVKWCPQPNCGHAITADMITGTIVKCSCGFRFCFTCHREAHAPVSCEQVKEWDKKCKDDTETTHWKYANTKDCPKCVTPVEKNGGCNHMTCRQCKHEWCWVCIRPWKGHNDFYNCNKFMKEDKKKKDIVSSSKSFFGGSRKKDRAKEREAERERNRIALERYLHFYERYANHSHSSELEKQIRQRALTKMAELQKEATTSSEVNYVFDGTEILLECRNALKYSYVYAYYLPESGSERELFEYLQEDLEKTTEQLSEVLETPGSSQMHRLKALNVIQLARTRKDNLLNAVEA